MASSAYEAAIRRRLQTLGGNSGGIAPVANGVPISGSNGGGGGGTAVGGGMSGGALSGLAGGVKAAGYTGSGNYDNDYYANFYKQGPQSEAATRPGAASYQDSWNALDQRDNGQYDPLTRDREIRNLTGIGDGAMTYNPGSASPNTYTRQQFERSAGVIGQDELDYAEARAAAASGMTVEDMRMSQAANRAALERFKAQGII